ncbi:hypothetical protein C8T65DRAFT_270571 [Cerioporus squamosus]|nr:hypothetical protein C8T65DRAFT_270571 [Cerioporus squamosus]
MLRRAAEEWGNVGCGMEWVGGTGGWCGCVCPATLAVRRSTFHDPALCHTAHGQGSDSRTACWPSCWHGAPPPLTKRAPPAARSAGYSEWTLRRSGGMRAPRAWAADAWAARAGTLAASSRPSPAARVASATGAAGAPGAASRSHLRSGPPQGR